MKVDLVRTSPLIADVWFAVGRPGDGQSPLLCADLKRLGLADEIVRRSVWAGVWVHGVLQDVVV